jgi:hypothetical protein
MFNSRKFLTKLRDLKINWKYILSELFLIFVVGGILGYLWWVKREISVLKKEPMKIEREGRPEAFIEEWKIQDKIAQVEIIARRNKGDKSKTDIFIKDFNKDQERFFTTLSGFELPELAEGRAEYRNGHLYLQVSNGLWKYNAGESKGILIFGTENEFYFTVSPSESALVIIEPLAEKLTIIDTLKKERKEINSAQLATTELVSFKNRIFKTYRVMLSLEIEKKGEWSVDPEAFWGFIYLRSSADPPVPVAYSIF